MIDSGEPVEPFEGDWAASFAGETAPGDVFEEEYFAIGWLFFIKNVKDGDRLGGELLGEELEMMAEDKQKVLIFLSGWKETSGS